MICPKEYMQTAVDLVPDDRRFGNVLTPQKPGIKAYNA